MFHWRFAVEAIFFFFKSDDYFVVKFFAVFHSKAAACLEMLVSFVFIDHQLKQRQSRMTVQAM
jgi:hypothetical protein